jgi:hypothetical protein
MTEQTKDLFMFAKEDLKSIIHLLLTSAVFYQRLTLLIKNKLSALKFQLFDQKASVLLLYYLYAMS